MQQKRFMLTLLIVNLLTSFSVNSITSRDKDQEKFHQLLATDKAFDPVGEVNLVFENKAPSKQRRTKKTHTEDLTKIIFSRCTGTLVDEQIVLSAASCFEPLLRENPAEFLPAQSTFRVGDKVYHIERIATHEEYATGTPRPNGQDLALLFLHTPVTGIKPAQFFRGNIIEVHDKKVYAVGFGYHGTPTELKYLEDSKRAGAQRITDIKNTMLISTFSYGEPDTVATNLGNQGGPQFFFKKKEAYLVGVISFRIIPPEFKTGLTDELLTPLGTIGYSTAVPLYLPWIEAKIKELKKAQEHKKQARRLEGAAGCQEHRWSEKECWDAHVPNNQSTAEFLVEISSPETVHLDKTIKVSELNINHPEASLIIPHELKTTLDQRSAEEQFWALDISGSSFEATEFKRTLIVKEDGTIFRIPQLIVERVHLNEGNLLINGELWVDSLEIKSGLLAGRGEIVNSTKPVINSGGSVAPSEPGKIGTLKIVGDYQQQNKNENQDSARLIIKVGHQGRFVIADKLIVQGHTVIGGTLEIKKIGSIGKSARLTIVESPRIEGTFEHIISPGLETEIIYAPDRIQIVVKDTQENGANNALVPWISSSPRDSSIMKYAENTHQPKLDEFNKASDRIKKFLGHEAVTALRDLLPVEKLAHLILKNKEKPIKDNKVTEIKISRTDSTKRPLNPSEWGQSAYWSGGIVPNNDEQSHFSVVLNAPDTILLERNIELNALELDHENTNLFIPGRLPTSFTDKTLEEYLSLLVDKGQSERAEKFKRNLVRSEEGEISFIPRLGTREVEIKRGLFRVDGELSVENLVLNGGRLRGKGKIDNKMPVENHSGAIEPGENNKAGSLKITGDYHQSAISDDSLGGVLRIKVEKLKDGNITNDMLIVDGITSLRGALEIQEIGLPLGDGDSITILESSTIKGAFDTVRTRVGLNAKIIYTNENTIKVIFNSSKETSFESLKETDFRIADGERLLLPVTNSFPHLHLENGEIIGAGQLTIQGKFKFSNGRISPQTEDVSQIIINGDMEQSGGTLLLHVHKKVVETIVYRTQGERARISPVNLDSSSLDPNKSLVESPAKPAKPHPAEIEKIVPSYEFGSDSIHINGDLVLKGGELDISYDIGAHFDQNQRYTIITANSIEGKFDSIRPWPCTLQPRLRYHPQSVELYFEAAPYGDATFNSIEGQQAAMLFDDSRADNVYSNELKALRNVLGMVELPFLEQNLLMFLSAMQHANKITVNKADAVVDQASRDLPKETSSETEEISSEKKSPTSENAINISPLNIEEPLFDATQESSISDFGKVHLSYVR